MRSLAAYTISTFVCMIAFQNCSGGFRADDRQPSSVLSSIGNPKSLFAVQAINEMKDNEPIDLAPFFSSSKVPVEQSRWSLFQTVGNSGDNTVVVQSKFNQLNNFEIFVVTPSAILMRYEVSPEIYGGDKNAMRRFRDVPVRAPDIRSATALPVNGDNGAIWFKRIVTKAEAGKIFVSAQAIDHVVYTNPGTLGALSVPYWPMYNWFELTKNTLQLPFVNSDETILRIYSQWSACTTEVYEYAQGVGLTAWRAFDSSSSGCNHNLDTSKPSVVMFNNFTGANERFYVVAGDMYDGAFSKVVYPSRITQAYTPGGIFMDDFRYHFTTANLDLLRFLRPVVQPPVVQPPVVQPPVVQPPVVQPPVVQPPVVQPPVVQPPVVQPPVVQPVHSAEIKSYYQMYLGRAPATIETSYWVDSITSGAISLAQAQQQIQNSQESIIRGFYLTYLLREPDSAGITYWRKVNDSGLSYDAIRNYIRADPACVAQCL